MFLIKNHQVFKHKLFANNSVLVIVKKRMNNIKLKTND